MPRIFAQNLAIYNVQQWKLAQNHTEFSKVRSIFFQILNKPSKSCQIFYKNSKVSKFRHMWSHCELRNIACQVETERQRERKRERGWSFNMFQPRKDFKRLLIKGRSQINARLKILFLNVNFSMTLHVSV